MIDVADCADDDVGLGAFELSLLSDTLLEEGGGGAEGSGGSGGESAAKHVFFLYLLVLYFFLLNKPNKNKRGKIPEYL